MRERHLGLVARLVLVVVVISALAAIVGGVFLKRASEASLRDEVVARHEQIAERLAVLLDDRIETFVGMLGAAATRAPIEQLRAGPSATELRVVLRATPEFEQLVLLDGRGRAIAAAARGHELEPRAIPARPDLVAGAAGEGNRHGFVGEPVPSLLLVVPVESPPGTPVGALAGLVNIDELSGRIEALRIGTSGFAFFVDATGRILAHRERDRVLARERFPIEQLDRRSSAARHGVLSDAETGPILAAAAAAEMLDGSVVVQQPEREALEPVRAAFTRFFVVLGLVAAAIVAGVMIAARSFLRPLSPLVSVVERFGRGEGDARAPHIRGRELGLLAAEFNAMADALDERVAQLRASEERFRLGFDHAPTGMLLASQDGRLVRVNDAFCAMVGRERSDLIGLPATALTHPDDRSRDEEAITRLLAGELPTYSTEKRYLRPDGSVVWALLSMSIVPGIDGEQRTLIGQARDISERKEVEATLEASSRMYAAAYDREREASMQLRALDEMKNTFLSAVSHELRTPLTSIVGFSETLLTNRAALGDEQADEFVARIVANARKLERLLGDLLDLDRLARGVLEPKRHRVDVGEIAARTVRASDAAAGRHVRVDVEAAEADVDAAMIERILENLLANASKHTPPSTPVWVRVRSLGDGVRLTVEDAGPGVAEDVRESIFQPFNRGGPARQDAPGTGIGLSLVARFAELHGGRAWVEERPGGGAAFHVFLPDPEAAPAPATSTAS